VMGSVSGGGRGAAGKPSDGMVAAGGSALACREWRAARRGDRLSSAMRRVTADLYFAARARLVSFEDADMLKGPDMFLAGGGCWSNAKRRRPTEKGECLALLGSQARCYWKR
jgi:hypothetical protein